jgi:hydrogenase maturation factor
VASAQRLLHDPGISVVSVSQQLLETGAVTALHDPTEGGVATGVREIAAASGLGAVMNRELVPLFEETRQIASYYEIDPLGMLSSGTMLASIRPEEITRVLDTLRDSGLVAELIGKLTSPTSGFHLIEGNLSRELPSFQTDEVTRALSESH